MRQILLIIIVICVSSVSTFAQSKPFCCVNGGIVNGKAKFLPIPEYPKHLETIPTDYVVKIRVTIDENGNVISAKAYSGDRVFWQSAETAVMKAKFSQINDMPPTIVVGTVVYNFLPPRIISLGILNKSASNFIQPEYPTDVKFVPKNKIVKVRVIVESISGNVISAKAFSGNRVFWKNAENSAKQTKFPLRGDGESVKVSGTVVYQFELPKIERNMGCYNGGVVNGKATKLVKPTYPKIQARAFGQVTVRVIIGENGNVISAVACNGNPLLRQSAVEAARQSAFPQTKLSGVPVKVSGVIIYNFTQR